MILKMQVYRESLSGPKFIKTFGYEKEEIKPMETSWAIIYQIFNKEKQVHINKCGPFS